MLKPHLFPLHTVSLFKFIDTSTGINQLLFAREEGVAVAADIHFQHFAILRRAGFKRSAASARNRYFMIIGMNVRFHLFSPRCSLFSLQCFPIITLFFIPVNCFCPNSQKILANFPKIRYTYLNLRGRRMRSPKKFLHKYRKEQAL